MCKSKQPKWEEEIEKKTITTPQHSAFPVLVLFSCEQSIRWAGVVMQFLSGQSQRAETKCWPRPLMCASALLEWQLVRSRKSKSWCGKRPCDLFSKLAREEGILKALWKSQDAWLSGQDIQSLGWQAWVHTTLNHVRQTALTFSRQGTGSCQEQEERNREKRQPMGTLQRDGPFPQQHLWSTVQKSGCIQLSPEFKKEFLGLERWLDG